jgi:hypothetical protein
MDAPMNVARATTNVSANDPMATALGGLAQQTQGALVEYEQAQAKQRENIGAVQSSNILSEADVYWQQNTSDRFKAYKVGDPDMRETIGTDFDKWSAEQSAKLPTDKSRQYFQVQANAMKSRLQQGAFKFQESATTNKLNADTDVGILADQNTVYNDNTRYNEVTTRRIETILARNDLSEAEKITAASKYKRGMDLAIEKGELERDPAGWYKRRFGTFDPGVGGTGAATPSGSITPGSKAVADAIYGQESSSGSADTSKVNPQNVTGPMQMQEGTFNAAKAKGLIPKDADWKNPADNKNAGYAWVEYLGKKYNGDTDKVAAAYYGGEGAVNSDGSINRDWKNKTRPNDPTIGEYVDSIRARISKQGNNPVIATVASNGNVPIASDDKPVQPKTFTGMDWEQQLAMKNHAETRLKQSEATFKAEATRTVQDAVAMHQDGVVDSFNLSKDYFARAYGADGARAYENYQKSRDMAADIGRFKTQSSAEIQAELESDKPQAGRGYAADDERYNTRVKAAAQVMEQRKKDPVGYVTANSDSLSAQRKAIDSLPQDQAASRPGMVQQFARDSLAEQTRLGIENPRILTPAQSDHIAAQASKALKADDSAKLIAGLEAEYGPDLFPKVFQQLVKEDKISNELLIIPNIPSQAARESVSRLSRIKESDLTVGIDSAAQKIVKDAVTEKLGDFARAVPYMTNQAASVTNSYESIMRKRAYELTQGGTKPADAVDQAYNQVLGHYAFDGVTRFPKSIDISAAKAGEKIILDKKIGDVDSPPDLTGSRDPAAVNAEWQRTVQSRPLWHTRDDDSGVQLYAMGNNGTKYRVTRGGQPVSYSWAELQSENAKAVQANSGGLRGKMKARDDAIRARILETRQQVENETGVQ